MCKFLVFHTEVNSCTVITFSILLLTAQKPGMHESGIENMVWFLPTLVLTALLQTYLITISDHDEVIQQTSDCSVGDLGLLVAEGASL